MFLNDKRLISFERFPFINLHICFGLISDWIYYVYINGYYLKAKRRKQNRAMTQHLFTLLHNKFLQTVTSYITSNVCKCSCSWHLKRNVDACIYLKRKQLRQLDFLKFNVNLWHQFIDDTYSVTAFICYMWSFFKER